MQPLRVNNNKLQINGSNTDLASNYQRKNLNFSLSNTDLENKTMISSKEDDMSFLDVLSRIQSNRLDDQRCTIKPPNQINKKMSSTNRLNEINDENQANDGLATKSNDDFFNLIMKSQRSRLEDQRTSISEAKLKSMSNSSGVTASSVSTSSGAISYSASSSNSDLSQTSKSNANNKNVINKKNQAITVPPDDDFFSMIQKIQSRRLDEQRTTVKSSLFSFLKKTPSGAQL